MTGFLFGSDAPPSIFRQGLALGLGGPDKRHDAEQVDRGHDNRDGAEGHQGAQPTEQKREGRRKVAHGIVAKPYSRTAKTCREDFREVDRVPCEARERSKPHDRQHPQHVGSRPQRVEHIGHRTKAKDKRPEERRAPVEVSGCEGKRKHTQQRSHILQEHPLAAGLVDCLLQLTDGPREELLNQLPVKGEVPAGMGDYSRCFQLEDMVAKPAALGKGFLATK